MKIGIPRALLYYRFDTLWRTFFQELGFETVLSPVTDKTILDEGSRYSIDENCLSSKLFFGHIAVLEGKCDAVFVPRIANYGKEGIMCTRFEALYDYYEGKEWMCRRIEKLEQDLQLLGRMTPFGAVNYIRFAMGYEEYLKEYAAYRRMKPEEFLERLDELQELSRGHRTAEEWFRHIEEYKETLAEEARRAQQEKSGVTISTLHSVKGLEYDCVYILDVNEGVMPYQKAVLAEDIEEERRMFYVGMTRARKQLTLCTVKERFDKKMEPSRFLEELL